jgi:hypothetical protein
MELNELMVIIENYPIAKVLHTTQNGSEYTFQGLAISRGSNAIKYFIPTRNGNGNNAKRVIINELLLYINEYLNTGQHPNSFWINNNLINAKKDGGCNICVIRKLASEIIYNHINL